MKIFLIYAFALGAFFALPFYYFVTLAIGFLIGCAFMHIQESEKIEKQDLLKKALSTGAASHRFTENGTTKYELTTSLSKVKIKEKTPHLFDGLPQHITTDSHSKNQTVDLFCKIFDGAFDRDIVNLVSLGSLQKIYNSYYKHRINSPVDPIKFKTFIEKIKFEEQQKLTGNSEIKKQKSKINLSIEECKKILASKEDLHVSESKSRYSNRIIGWKKECLVDFYQKGVKIEDLSLIFNISENQIKGKLVGEGVYIEEKIEKIIDPANTRRNDVIDLIIKISSILDLEYETMSPIRFLGRLNLIILEKILKYQEDASPLQQHD